jgi:hypothetical protein
MPLCTLAFTIARNPWARDFRDKILRLALCTVALAAPLWCSAFATADECGILKVSGYSARRTVGPLELRVFVSPEKERTEEIGGAGEIRVMEFGTMAAIIMNPKNKAAIMAPPPPKPPGQSSQADQKNGDKFVDREPGKDGLVIVSMGLKTPKGKEWMIQTSCRPDGIWVERKINTPRGLVTMHQGDVKIGAIPATQFEVPGDYKMIQPRSQPTGKD